MRKQTKAKAKAETKTAKKRPKQNKKISKRQKDFVARYLVHGNIKQAAHEVGYKQPQMAGSRMFALPKVQEEIRRLTATAESKTLATIDDRKRRLAEIMKSESLSDACRAVDILNKMDAIYIKKMEMALQIKMSPEEAEKRVVEAYRADPELWARIKEGVEEA